MMAGCRLLWGGHREDGREKQKHEELHLADCAEIDLPARLYRRTAFTTTRVTNINLYTIRITSNLLNLDKPVIIHWNYP
jgi:hypothetical protein